MTEPTTEELVDRLRDQRHLMQGDGLVALLATTEQAAQRLSDLEGKLGEARKALEPFAGWQADCPRCVASKFTCDAHYRASEALKLTASGGGEGSSSASSTEHSGSSTPRTSAPNSAGGLRPSSEMPADIRAAVDAKMSGSWLNSLTRDDDEWFFDMDGKP